MALHRWSGWPGAYCLDCGQEDPIETALAMNWLVCYPDYEYGEPYIHCEYWIDPEKEKLCLSLLECKEPGSDRFNPYVTSIS